MKGKLYLIPSTIGETPVQNVIPQQVVEIINNIKYYIVENERTARRQLIKMGIKTLINQLEFLYSTNIPTKRVWMISLNPAKNSILDYSPRQVCLPWLTRAARL